MSSVVDRYKCFRGIHDMHIVYFSNTLLAYSDDPTPERLCIEECKHCGLQRLTTRKTEWIDDDNPILWTPIFFKTDKIKLGIK